MTSNNDNNITIWNQNIQIRRICCIGAGYVGGPTMAIIALKCPEIRIEVVDSSADRIKQWNSDNLPIYEPDLDEIVNRCRNTNLFFSNSVEEQIELADMIFISVDTPTKKTGIGKGRAAEMKNLEYVSRLIAKHSKSNKIIVEKSTVPVKAAESIKNILASNKPSNIEFEVLSNPEFMAEGTAVENLINPDRILIGGDTSTKTGQKAIEILKSIYSNWIDQTKIITTNTFSSELSKLVANAFLAQRLSSINSIATLCESTGADIEEVSKAIGTDSRIGPKFLKAGIGFGGSCFQKDVLNLVYLCECLNLKEVADYWYKVIEMNQYQRTRVAKKIVNRLHNTINTKNIAIFGFAFKANTGDTRESPAKFVCHELLEEGARLRIYDPKVPNDKIISDLKNLDERDELDVDKSVEIFDEPYECVKGCHCIVICTEWAEFALYDYTKIYSSMEKPAHIFDGRRILDADKLRNIGFNIETIGSASSPRCYNWI